MYLRLVCVAGSLRPELAVAIGVYNLNWLIVRSFSGAALLSESWLVFQS